MQIQMQTLTYADACGNSFWFIESDRWIQNSENGNKESENRIIPIDVIKQLLKKKEADGIVFWGFSKNKELHWDFYNRDGSTAEFCGNAARALIQLSKSPFFYIQHQRISGGTTQEGLSYIEVPLPKALSQANIILAGVPHRIIPITDPNLLNTPDSLRALSIHYRSEKSHITPKGCNVTYALITDESQNLLTLRALTFERGVEDFTLSCGSGALAAAIYFYHQSQMNRTTRVQFPGGTLEVQIFPTHAQLAGAVNLTPYELS